jgi:hypothetical protein
MQKSYVANITNQIISRGPHAIFKEPKLAEIFDRKPTLLKEKGIQSNCHLLVASTIFPISAYQISTSSLINSHYHAHLFYFIGPKGI